ncbi:PepSY-like domain-containing protein [Flavobacterium sp. N1736]|uniref:PepSY-like domain-containing protein n=1 Tax=Flavobacterium sp. N1736 TaxID=2986823 RepID=UPI0022258460|nr:PepSY-like domain-containing protein [Flavobacterium sp. N1736]
MKKTFLTGFIALSLLVSTTSCDSNDDNGNNEKTTIQSTELPTTAKTFTETYFPSAVYKSVLKSKTPSANGSVYDISLANGFEIDFDANGNWTEIDGGNQAIPTALIPAKINAYVAANYPELFIVQIENEKTKYDVELSNDLDLVFTMDGDFVRIDHDGDNHNEVVVNPTTLPAAAKTFISTHFPDAIIRLVEKQNTAGTNGSIYDVSLSNGFEIDFDVNGNWTEIDGNRLAIPTALIPAKISLYVTANYPNLFVTAIDKEKTYIDVELSNDVDLVFDLQENFLRTNN